MQTSELRDLVRSETLDFAWAQWAQMGVFATSERSDRWAADPEALLVFTLEVARHDPRLFDEVLDWLRTNERLLSVQRLRNLCRDDRDRALAEAVLEWLSRYHKNPRFERAPTLRAETPVPLFPELRMSIDEADPAFLASGFLKSASEPRGMSRPPRRSLEINFAFRMRDLFGVSSRAEIVRYLLTSDAPDVPAQTVAEVTAYAKRNVFITLEALGTAGVVRSFGAANEKRYSIDRDRWRALLELDRLPLHRSWPRLLWALRAILRWLDDEDLDRTDDYLRSSLARDLVEQLGDALLFAGLPIPEGRVGTEYWDGFVETVENVLGQLRSS